MDAETRDRVALITGAGSPTGIGFATARVFGREGAAIAIASTTERIHERAAELAGMGFEAAGFTADLTIANRHGRWSRPCSKRSGGSTSS